MCSRCATLQARVDDLESLLFSMDNPKEALERLEAARRKRRYHIDDEVEVRPDDLRTALAYIARFEAALKKIAKLPEIQFPTEAVDIGPYCTFGAPEIARSALGGERT